MSVTASVIIALWNAETTIERCIISIINQSEVDLEIIVVDDCSTDGSVGVVKRLMTLYPNLILLRNSKNSGPSKTRNNGINAANGKWLVVVDSDDFIGPMRIKKMIEFSESQNADFCFDNLSFVSPNGGKFKTKNMISDRDFSLLDCEWSIEMYTNLNKPYESDVLIGFLKPIINRAFLNNHSIRYEESIKNSEDYLLVLKSLILKAKVVYLNEADYYYSVDANSLSGKFDLSAHDKLINYEVVMLNEFRDTLQQSEINAIEKHIQSLRNARTTNLMFKFISQKRVRELLRLFSEDYGSIPLHINRLGYAVIRKVIGYSNRGK